MTKGAFHSKKSLPGCPADHKCLVVNLWLQHIYLADIISFKLSTHSNGLVIYLGMYVALPWQQILSDFDIVPAAAVYLTHH